MDKEWPEKKCCVKNQALKCLQVSVLIDVKKPGLGRQLGLSQEPINELVFMKCGSPRGILHSVIAPFAGLACPWSPQELRPEKSDS